MKQFPAAQIRNVALVGHQESGKTMLSESLLYTAGAIPRLGRIEDKNTTMDYDSEEIARGISIHSGVAHLEHAGTKVNLIDTPGYEDFVGDVLLGLDVVEGAIVCLRADAGVEVGTDRVWGFLQDRGLPALFVANRMDKEHADYDRCLALLHEHFGGGVHALQVPIGAGDKFRGVVDLIDMKAYEFERDGKGAAKPIDIPADLKEKASALRKELMESAAESDEKLMEKYLETESLSEEEFRAGLAAGVRTAQIFPVLCASAAHNMGAALVLDSIVRLLPGADAGKCVTVDDKVIKTEANGAPLAYVFKNISDPHVGDMLCVRVFHGVLAPALDVHNTTRNNAERLGGLFVLEGKNRQDADKLQAGDIGALVKLKVTKVRDTLGDKASGTVVRPTALPKPSINSAILPVAKGDDEKMGSGLHRIMDEDPTFEVTPSAETHQTIIAGQGELHLEIIVHRLKERFGVNVQLEKPRIPYRETIRRPAEAQGRHKKQTGGRGQFGDVWLKIEPLQRGKQFEFVDGVVGGVVPGKFIPAVEKGVVATMEMGVIAGYPMVDVRATIYDGSYHTVDSSEQAFKTAGSLAFKAAVEKANPV
ncbi:MAG TPA: elongation factor G, partial [Candidatus Krumholzibacteria bacterium]|nr:elongation factor G [Candidatus Krumholzibacteria bacterium]